MSRPGNAPTCPQSPWLVSDILLNIISQCGLRKSRTFGFVYVDTIIIILGCVLFLCGLVHQAADNTFLALYYRFSRISCLEPAKQTKSQPREERVQRAKASEFQLATSIHA